MGLIDRWRGWRAPKSLEQGETFGIDDFYTALGIDPHGGSDMGEATFYACVRVLSESVAKLQLHLMRRDPDDGGVSIVRDDYLSDLVGFRPNRYTSAPIFWSEVERNRSVYGNAYVWVRGAGKGMSLWVLPNDSVQVWYDNAKLLATQPDLYYLYTAGDGKTYTLGSEEVLHFRTFDSEDGIVGKSVSQRLGDTIAGNVAGQRMTTRLWESSGTNKMILQYTGDLSEKSTQKFVRGVEAYARGSASTDRLVIPIPVGASLTPITQKMADSQFLELRKHSALEIAAAFGIKPTMIGQYDKASYSSATQQQLAFLTDTLLYIVEGYEAELTYKLLPYSMTRDGYFFKANLGALLRADQATQVQTLSTGVNSFLYTPNEARALLDLPAVEGGDKLLGNGSAIPVAQAGNQYPSDDAGDDEGKEV